MTEAGILILELCVLELHLCELTPESLVVAHGVAAWAVTGGRVGFSTPQIFGCAPAEFLHATSRGPRGRMHVGGWAGDARLVARTPARRGLVAIR